MRVCRLLEQQKGDKDDQITKEDDNREEDLLSEEDLQII